LRKGWSCKHQRAKRRCHFDRSLHEIPPNGFVICATL
jgi:hypothetical protein